jgi:hypothetical protein
VGNYLSICSAYRNEAPYLREWIEFHRLVGVEHFYLYDNRSEDDHQAQLAPYIDAGLVTLTDWPLSPGQCQAFRDCIEQHRDDVRWLACIDLDEFLFSPTLRPVSELLTEYEAFPGVGVNMALFGASGHRVPPAGLTLESYDSRGDEEVRWSGAIKSIVHPARALRCAEDETNPHGFLYADGELAVNELMQPIDTEPPTISKPVSYGRLRINHYWMRSEQQWREKMESPMACSGKVRGIPSDRFDRFERIYSTVHDETAQAYLPPLRRALERPAAPVSAEPLREAI